MTAKLLSRPPFKFILDIVMNIIAATGYLKKEITEKEIETANTDKDTKRHFLEKLIKLIDDGSLGKIKATEILGGKDTEGANKMLQKLGTNATSFAEKEKNGTVKKKKKSDKDDKKGDEEKKPKKSKSSSKEDEKSTTPKRKSKKVDGEMTSDAPGSETEEESKKSKSKSKSSSDEKKKKSRSSSKDRADYDEPSTKSSSKSTTKTSEKKTKKTKEKPEPSTKTDPSERQLRRQDSMIAVNGDAPNTPTNDNVSTNDSDDEQGLPNPTVLRSRDNENSAESFLVPPSISQNGKESDADDRSTPLRQDDLVPLQRLSTAVAGGRPMTSMGRPGTSSSRLAPPKLKKKQLATVDATPQVVVGLRSEIMSEGATTLELENDDNFLIENSEDEGEKTARISELVDEEDRGILVQKIMETKAGIEDSATTDRNADLGADNGGSVEKEKVRQLQEKLQDLTKSAYPLARLFDFANDDIESMMKEMERWRSEQRKNEQEEHSKKASGFGDNSRLYNVITSLQSEIQNTKEELSKTRGRVLSNEKRIQFFISNI